jgi:hypothetical protein
MADPRSPKCDSRMEEGFILDHTHGGRLQAAWVEGKPQRSFWTGLKVKEGGTHAVVTFRCERCGYLESFAPAT